MKKSTKYLLIVLGIVIVLGAAVLVLVLTDPNRGEEEESSAVEDTSITLNEREEAELASMEVTFRDNEAGSYTLLSVEPADDSEDISFTVEGLEELSLSTSTLNSVASFGYGLTATRDLGTLENAAEYGLDDPQVSVLVTFTDGSTFSYDIGNETPTSGYYVKTGDSDSLYICTLGANIFKQKLEMVDDTILSITPPESEESSSSTTGTATNTYNSLTLSGKNFEEPVEIIYEPDSTLMSTYRMVSPSEVGCDDEKISAITAYLDALSAEEVAAVYPTDEDLAAFGLDDPVSTLSFRVNDTEEHTLISGGETDTGTYVMVDDVPVVYVVDSSTVSEWADATMYSLRTSFLLLPFIDDVSAVTIETADVEHSFTITRTEDEENSTEDDPAYILSVKGSDGQDLTTDTFRSFYQVLLGARLFDMTEETVSGTPYMTLTYSYHGGGADVLEFYESQESDRSYVVVLNGDIQGIVKKTSVDSILSNAEDMENDINVSA